MAQRSSARRTTCSNILRSAFSQLSSPQVSSSRIRSKYPPSGPAPSTSPTMDAPAAMRGGASNTTVCLPKRFCILRPSLILPQGM